MIRLAGEAFMAVRGVVAGWVRRVAARDGDPGLEVRQEGSGDQLVIRRGEETLVRVTAEGGIAGPVRLVPQSEPEAAAEGYAYYDSAEKRLRWHDGLAWRGSAAAGDHADITSLSGLITPLDVAQGGTGGSTVAGARAKLGIGRSVFSALGRPMGCDVAASDPDLRDFYGGFTDGVYGYLVPFGMGESRSGKVARLDLRDFASVTSLDLTTAVRRLTFVAGKEGGIRRGDTVTGAISGATATVAGVAVTSGAWATGDAAGDLYLRDQTGSFVAESLNAGGSVGIASVAGNSWESGLLGFLGGFTDGRYGYLVPQSGSDGLHGRAARIDLADFASVEVIPLDTLPGSPKGFGGGFTDGVHAYFVPTFTGCFARVKLANLDEMDALDLTALDGDLTGFVGGFTDGRYGYLVPWDHGARSGKVVRVDLTDFASVAVLNLAAFDSELKGFIGGFTDGRYAYLVPYDNGQKSGKVARVDLADFSSITTLDLEAVDPDLKGFYGGFTDGRYGYFVPNAGAVAKLARVDLEDFSTVSICDLTAVHPQMRGYCGGYVNGGYGYLVPSFATTVARLQLGFGGGL